MTVQRLFFIATIVFLVATALLLAMAAYVFVSQDIRAVKDDLSGRTRRANLDRLRERNLSRQRKQVHGQRESEAVRGTRSSVSGAEWDMAAIDAESPVFDVSYDIDDGSDDMPTVVTAVNQYHVGGYVLNAASNASQERMWNQNAANQNPGRGDSSIEIVRRIVLIHSDGVITAS